jgi:hypothetical protein
MLFLITFKCFVLFLVTFKCFLLYTGSTWKFRTWSGVFLHWLAFICVSIWPKEQLWENDVTCIMSIFGSYVIK